MVGPLPPPFGGMANQTKQLSELLRGEGIKVDLIQSNAPYRPSWVGKIRGVRAFARLVPHFYQLLTTLHKAQVVHVMANSGWAWYFFAMPAILVARLFSIPVVVNYRGGKAEKFLEKHVRLVRPLLRKAGSVVVPSGYLKEVFGSFDINTRVVPNIVDLERFRPLVSRPVDDNSLHLASCRNLEEIYDIETTLKAFKEISRAVPEAYLTVAGEGPEKARLMELADELQISPTVRFTGRLNLAEMAELYQTADIMINSSRVDNMPNALLEAMAAGVPIVTTDAGGIRYIVENGVNGVLVPVGDWKKIAEAVIFLSRNKDTRSVFVQNGQKLVRNFSWQAVNDNWMQVYKELVKAAKR